MVMVWWPSIVFTQVVISVVFAGNAVVFWLVKGFHTSVTLPQMVTLSVLLAILHKQLSHFVYIHDSVIHLDLQLFILCFQLLHNVN